MQLIWLNIYSSITENKNKMIGPYLLNGNCEAEIVGTTTC